MAMDHNQFCWNELGTTDTKAATAFYAAVFGWETAEMPMGPGEVYTLFKGGGKELGGMYALKPEQLQMGVPPHWLPYIAVAGAAETVAKVRAAGGMVLLDSMPVPGVGNIAVFKDPQGAAFGILEPEPKS